MSDLDAMIADSMKDVDLDSIEVTEDDLMDDSLLAELQDVIGACSHYGTCVVFLLLCMYV